MVEHVFGKAQAVGVPYSRTWSSALGRAVIAAIVPLCAPTEGGSSDLLHCQ